jgi:hypothetical protein
MPRLPIILASAFVAVILPTSASSTPTTAVVPVVICPTSVGVPTSPVPVPATAKVSAPAAHLTMYSTVSADLDVLAPPGFFCEAIIGADGSARITAWSPKSASETIATGGVAALVYPACVGCMLSFACPFFPGAEKSLRRSGGPACATRPPGQVARRLNAYTIAISDPPGERVPASEADGLLPSGAPYPTYGVIAYGTYPYEGHRPDVAFGAACVLPASEHQVCTTVLNEFLASEGEKFPGLAGA